MELKCDIKPVAKSVHQSSFEVKLHSDLPKSSNIAWLVGLVLYGHIICHVSLSQAINIVRWLLVFEALHLTLLDFSLVLGALHMVFQPVGGTKWVQEPGELGAVSADERGSLSQAQSSLQLRTISKCVSLWEPPNSCFLS